MGSERGKISRSESVKNALSGYGVVVLGTVCFLLLLAVITTVVRILLIGAGAGA